MFPFVEARHPQDTSRESSWHVRRQLGQVLVLHGHEHSGQMNAAAGAEYLGEVGPQIRGPQPNP